MFVALRFSSCLIALGLSLLSQASWAQLLNEAPSSTNIFTSSARLDTDLMQDVLPADSAFNLRSYIETPNSIVLLWDIEDGYYIYRKSFSLKAKNNIKLEAPIIPTGLKIEDEFFGEVEVFYNQLLIRVPFDSPAPNKLLELELNYQGCSEGRYCYPMQTVVISLEIL